MTTLLWFRRDLRLADHPALAAAAKDGQVLGVFVADDTLLQASGLPRKAYLARTLAALDESMDGRLLIVHGRPDQVLPFLARSVEATAVHVTGDAGGYGRQRDETVAQALDAVGVDLVATGSAYAVDPGTVRKPDGSAYAVFTPWHRVWSERPVPRPVRRPTVDWVDPDSVELGRGRRWLPDELGPALPSELTLPETGEAAARRGWKQFRDHHLADYDTDRDRPDRDTTSRMSPHLKWGTIHPRTLLADLDGLSGKGPASYRRELGFREFYADVLFHRPESARQSLDPVVDRMRWDGPGDALQAWEQGLTGYPYIDAGMRQLLTEGWMHNRVRMAVASFLVKDLHLPWQLGARHFLRHLVDGDTASNNHGWQWAAGSAPHAAPFFRIFNPIGQGEKHDPTGEYVRRHVPELRGIGGKAVHKPWDLPDGPPNGYPLPIVDHGAERAVALADWADRPRS